MSDLLPAGVPNQMLIGGKWLDSDGGTFDVLNPGHRRRAHHRAGAGSRT